NHTDCPLTDFGGKTSIFSHPVYLFLRKFSLQDSRGGSMNRLNQASIVTLSVRNGTGKSRPQNSVNMACDRQDLTDCVALY
ncbi:hypothetical protein OFO97_17280, partial [Escherichia coli]|nr:hypothetical protein [Escherichia coli]